MTAALPVNAPLIITFRDHSLSGCAMRIAVLCAAFVLSSCASDQLASTPPRGVDLSGHWKLNEADSDDPLRLMQTQLSNATANASAGGQTGGGGSRRSGGRGGAGGMGPQGPQGPVMPSVAILDDALHWPGKDLTVSQTNGVVTFADGRSRTCRLGGPGKHRHHPPPGGDAPSNGPRNRDMPSRGRGDAAAPLCGWDEGTLVVKSGESEEDHAPYELRFSLSDDHERLVEVVSFMGGRSSGFTASREWDRLQQ
jgi:hypothetical protein